MSEFFAEPGDYPPIVERQILEKQIRERIEELGPTEDVYGDDELHSGLKKMRRNNERMILRIRLFDLKGMA